jgi:CRP-like cAMP-binding protein
MEKINDKQRILHYVEQHHLSEFFGQDMVPHMELFYYKKYEALCTMGEELNYFLLFVEGCAKVYNLLKNGKSLMLRFYHPMKVIGDVELVMNTKVFCCIEAVTPVYCLAIPMEVMRRLCLNDAVFLRNISESLAYKLVTASMSSSINQLYSLKNKLAAYILGSVKALPPTAHKVFQCNMTQLAELLGTSYRHLMRTLVQLVDEGVLKKSRNGYEVVNMEGLEGLSADLYE